MPKCLIYYKQNEHEAAGMYMDQLRAAGYLPCPRNADRFLNVPELELEHEHVLVSDECPEVARYYEGQFHMIGTQVTGVPITVQVVNLTGKPQMADPTPPPPQPTPPANPFTIQRRETEGEAATAEAPAKIGEIGESIGSMDEMPKVKGRVMTDTEPDIPKPPPDWKNMRFFTLKSEVKKLTGETPKTMDEAKALLAKEGVVVDW